MWKEQLTRWEQARESLERLEQIAAAELPFAAIVARHARSASSIDELQELMASIYRIGLDHGHPTVPDIANEVLTLIEQGAEH